MEPVSNHRQSIFNRSRSGKKSSLKRSKSLHCPKSQRFNELQPHHYQPNGNQLGELRSQQGSNGMNGNGNGGAVSYYSSRRHHSTNDYSAADQDDFPFVVNSSSHNLYYQYQNGQQPSSQQQPVPARGSCSSGTSVASLSESYQQANSSRKPSDFYEDVFYENNQVPVTINSAVLNGVQSQLVSKMGSLTLSNKDTNGQHQRNGSHRRYAGSSSNSSLYSGHPSNDLSVFLDAFDVDKVPEYNEDNDNLWDDFVLEPLQETVLVRDRTGSNPTSNNNRTGKKSSSNSGESRTSTTSFPQFRFYMIKQRNYPPLFLENMHNRRRIYRILVLGYPSSGKTSLIEQFGAHLGQCDRTRFNPAAASELNDRHNLLIHFLESDSFDKYLLQMPVTDYQPDVYLILFSANNRDSFNSVKKTLIDLQRWDDVETKSIIIVANKSDLVRGRCVTRREGRDLASANNCKYIETSCTISHQIDVLLQGIGSQICLKEEQLHKQKELEQLNGMKMKRKPSFFKRILRKTAINKSKSCDNLHVL